MLLVLFNFIESREQMKMNRRQLIGWLAGVSLLPSAVLAQKATTQKDPLTDSSVNDWTQLTDAQWQKRLSRSQYEVLREEGTEPPFSSELNDEKREGAYHCAGCDLPLFQSTTKYDSGTGWPSFYDVIEGAVQTRTDYKLIWPRTEYHCSRCKGHQGHVFEDGPAPTGLRYCNNGVALRFMPKSMVQQ